MKTALKALVVLLAVAAGMLPAAGQEADAPAASGEVGELDLLAFPNMSSLITQYPSQAGTKELVRSNADNSCIVTSVYASNQRTCFLVKNGGTVKTFYTSELIAPMGQNKGHEVLDMEIADSICWVCGRFWHETGQLIYNLDGTSYMEKEYTGFIGRFNINAILDGGGTFETYPVIGTSEVSRIATNGAVLAYVAHDGALAGDATLLPGNVLHVVKVTPPKPGEVFMDVVFAESKFVFLSRFQNLGSYYNRHRIGLRYVSPLLTDGMHTMHVYDTWMLFHSDGWFAGLDPIYLSKTNSGNGVAVSWIETDQNNPDPGFIGHLFVLKVDSEGATSFSGYYSTDDDVYTKIKGAEFGMPAYNNPYFTVLLEDENGNSVVRFIKTDCANQYTCSSPMLSLSEPMLASVLPIQTSSVNLKFNAMGYYADESNKVAELTELSVLNHPLTWQANNCMTVKPGQTYTGIDPTSYTQNNETDNKTVTVVDCLAEIYTLAVSNAPSTVKCYGIY